ncbi:sugar transferase [Kineosporia sp. NBRC 101731]|uniref:sugar transferase n=1 Tax=Kineosporia sp. NBRC 101731 TaxID=3032199 RepID=UPI0024A01F41|nr:sugar transferase [Kineosporia sp. NBRC 101731]GLY28700.1 exopolysaccharide biosynthesis polyprenyl glycosylphosphotransferase [Kineosporia sp. NBRC 101731]
MAVMEPGGNVDQLTQLDDVVARPSGPPSSGTVPRQQVHKTGRHIGAGSAEPGAMMRRYQRMAVASDGLASLLGGVAASVVRFGEPDPTYIAFTLLLPMLWIAIITAQRGYERRFLGTGPEEYRRINQAGLMMFCLIAVVSYALRSEVARGYVFLAIPVTLLLTLAFRRQLRGWIYRLRDRGLALQRVLVVGRADVVVSVIEKLDNEPQHGLVPVGACVPFVGVEVSHVNDVPVVGDPERVLDAVEATGAHVVAVVSHPDLSGQALRRLSWALEERGVELIVSPGIIEVAGPRLSIRPIAGLSLLHLERPSANGGRMMGKVVFDRVGALLLTLLALPLLLLIAVAIKVTSPGPVLYRQTRVGAGGREFLMLKFRSMVVDADRRRAALLNLSEGNGVLFKLRKDPRVTRVGGLLRRLSLDELPQLLNVVRGDMSLVGPRPPLPEEVAAYSDDAVRRLKVKPGLTGLWQVSGRSDLNWEESLRLDLRYTDNWSIALDVTILWRTVRAVVRGAGAY